RRRVHAGSSLKKLEARHLPVYRICSTLLTLKVRSSRLNMRVEFYRGRGKSYSIDALNDEFEARQHAPISKSFDLLFKGYDSIRIGGILSKNKHKRLVERETERKQPHRASEQLPRNIHLTAIVHPKWSRQESFQITCQFQKRTRHREDKESAKTSCTVRAECRRQRLNQPVDVMVSQEKLNEFYKLMESTHMKYEVFIEDVQRLIDTENPHVTREDNGYSHKKYHTLDEIYQWFELLTKKYPDLLGIVSTPNFKTIPNRWHDKLIHTHKTHAGSEACTPTQLFLYTNKREFDLCRLLRYTYNEVSMLRPLPILPITDECPCSYSEHASYDYEEITKFLQQLVSHALKQTTSLYNKYTLSKGQGQAELDAKRFLMKITGKKILTSIIKNKLKVTCLELQLSDQKNLKRKSGLKVTTSLPLRKAGRAIFGPLVCEIVIICCKLAIIKARKVVMRKRTTTGPTVYSGIRTTSDPSSNPARRKITESEIAPGRIRTRALRHLVVSAGKSLTHSANEGLLPRLLLRALSC
ncbi:unnamed protein product, partial [Trichogramma brassicae]